jgi:acetyl-CoA carboxylase alpha subunit
MASSSQPEEYVKLALLRNFEFKLPLAWLLATPGAAPSERTAERKSAAVAATSKLRLRFSLWQNRLPVDSLPLEGWIELHVLSEGELIFGA